MVWKLQVPLRGFRLNGNPSGLVVEYFIKVSTVLFITAVQEVLPTWKAIAL